MEKTLQSYIPVSLEQMKAVRLMNRIDTKYVTTLPKLVQLLEMARDQYWVQEIDGKRNMPYYTLYYDTEQYDMYQEHQRGKKTRQKIRIRAYEHSGVSFLEVKKKNNKGRTSKKRVECKPHEKDAHTDFIASHLLYPPEGLLNRIENRFSRITLVNRNMTERLTIDTGLRFHNFSTNKVCRLDGLVIIELKRDGQTFSPILELLRQLRIKPSGFSKYCMGMALTDENLRRNNFKPRLHMVNKICHVDYDAQFA
jgi:hypothetical protein